MCAIDDAGSTTSPRTNSSAAAALAHIHRIVSYECVTPFAGPVLPDVKKMTAGSDGWAVSSSTAEGAPAASDSNVTPSALESP
jgi:hypothetical protein